jgi:hypothetical protein
MKAFGRSLRDIDKMITGLCNYLILPGMVNLMGPQYIYFTAHSNDHESP